MSSQPSPSDMSRDELEAEVRILRDRIDGLEFKIGQLESVFTNLLQIDVDGDADQSDRLDELCRNAAQLQLAQDDDLDALREDITSDRDRVHRERAKLQRRLSVVEEELGIAATDALATAEGGEDAHRLSKLGRLVRHGPAAVSDNPTETMFRAKELVENWNRWGMVRDDDLGKERRLASSKHDLKTRLEDARQEDLAWMQVYRAMELVAEWSDDHVSLQDGSSDEGKHVLVHRIDADAAEPDT